MQECIGATEVEADPDVPIHHAVAQFCCFAGKRRSVISPLAELVFTFRGTEDDEQKVTVFGPSVRPNNQRDLLHALNAYAPGCREALHSLHVPHPKRAEIEMMIKSTDLFIAELCCESGTWGALERLIQVGARFRSCSHAETKAKHDSNRRRFTRRSAFVRQNPGSHGEPHLEVSTLPKQLQVPTPPDVLIPSDP